MNRIKHTRSVSSIYLVFGIDRAIPISLYSLGAKLSPGNLDCRQGRRSFKSFKCIKTNFWNDGTLSKIRATKLTILICAHLLAAIEKVKSISARLSVLRSTKQCWWSTLHGRSLLWKKPSLINERIKIKRNKKRLPSPSHKEDMSRF